MASTRFVNYSVVSTFFWRVGSDCLNYGQLDPTGTLTPDTVSHALGYVGESSFASLPEVIYKRFDFGKARYLGSAFAGIEPIPEFTIELSSVDANLDVLANGATIDTTTIANVNLWSPNHNNQSPNRIGLMMTVASQPRGTGCDGGVEYSTFVIPSCQIFVNRAGGSTDAGTDTQAVTVTVSPDMATHHAWGAQFGSNENFAGNKTEIVYLQGDNPYAVTAWVADGIETTYEVEYVAASNAVTSGNTTNVFSIDGTVTAPTSFDPATGVVTIAAAGTTGDLHTAFYQIETPNIRTI
jgi:hypothetical protein